MKRSPPQRQISGEVFMNISDAIKSTARTKEELDLPKVNGMVIGITSVGKSSLINAFFMHHVAKEAVGERGTVSFEKYENMENGFTLIDTIGFELYNSEINTFHLIRDNIEALSRNTNRAEQLHFVWYAVLNSHRINDFEIELIQWIKGKNIPVIIVLTQTMDSDIGLENVIKRELPLVPVVNVLAKAKTLIGDIQIRPFGIDTLLNVTQSMLYKQVFNSFVTASIATILDRFESAKPIIQDSIDSAHRECYTRIPFKSIRPYLINEISKMIRSLSSLLGLKGINEEFEAKIPQMCDKATKCLESQIVGSRFLKIIPIIGTELGRAMDQNASAKIISGVGHALLDATSTAANNCYKNLKVLETNDIIVIFDKNYDNLIKHKFVFEFSSSKL